MFTIKQAGDDDDDDKNIGNVNTHPLWEREEEREFSAGLFMGILHLFEYKSSSNLIPS